MKIIEEKKIKNLLIFVKINIIYFDRPGPFYIRAFYVYLFTIYFFIFSSFFFQI